MWISKSLFNKILSDKDNEIEYLRNSIANSTGKSYVPTKRSLGISDLKLEALSVVENIPVISEQDKLEKEEAISQINRLIG